MCVCVCVNRQWLHTVCVWMDSGNIQYVCMCQYVCTYVCVNGQWSHTIPCLFLTHTQSYKLSYFLYIYIKLISSLRVNFFEFMCVCVCVSAGVCKPQCLFGGQGTTFGSRFSPFHLIFEIGSLVMFPLYTPGWLAFELPGDTISGSDLFLVSVLGLQKCATTCSCWHRSQWGP